MATNYGDRAWEVLGASSSANTRLLDSFPFLESEVRHAVRSEAACTTSDVISRRTRLSFLDVESTLRALPRVIDIMAEELKWTDARKEQEWTATVQFLKSMGLAKEKLTATREDVVSGKLRLSIPQQTAKAFSNGGEVKLNELSAGNTLAQARSL